MSDILARTRSIIGSKVNWQNHDRICGDGEIVLMRDASQIRAKVGDGVRPFSQLRYLAGSGTLPPALNFRGVRDLTAAAPGAPAAGDVWSNSTAGVAHASWAGIGGQPVAELDLASWDGSAWQIMGNAADGGLRLELAGPSGASLIGYGPRTLQEKAGESVSILDRGADPTGAVSASAAIVAALAAAGRVDVPDGIYLITEPIEVGDNKQIHFSKGAVFNAGVDGLVFFKSSAHAYFSQIWNPTLEGNGHAGVVGFDLLNMRLQAGIFNPSCQHMATGLILRSGCFGLLVLNPATLAVPNPLIVTENCSVLEIHNPTFDNSAGVGGDGSGVGIDVWAGAGSNIGVRIVGGFIQGFDIGVQDAALATRVDGTYFENCLTADVSAVGTRGADYRDIVHFGPIGAAGYKLNSCDATTIFNPLMASGARTALYNVDASNTNCREYRPPNASSMNEPTGPLTYLGSIAQQTVGTFVPVVSGSGAAGVGTYTQQAGKWSRTGNVVHFDLTVGWSAHTGAGNLIVSGLPAGLAPANYSPGRLFQLALTGMPWTGPMIFGTFNGVGTNIAPQQVNAAGAAALVPLAASGVISISGSFEL